MLKAFIKKYGFFARSFLQFFLAFTVVGLSACGDSGQQDSGTPPAASSISSAVPGSGISSITSTSSSASSLASQSSGFSSVPASSLVSSQASSVSSTPSSISGTPVSTSSSSTSSNHSESSSMTSSTTTSISSISTSISSQSSTSSTSSVLVSSSVSSSPHSSSSSAASSSAPEDLAHLWGGPVSLARQQALNSRVFTSSRQPYIGHPRLYGSNAQWIERVRRFDELDPRCEFGGIHNGVGTVKNMQAMWDVITRGGRRCANQQPATPLAHALAKPYLDGTLNTNIRGTYTDRLRLLHLIRRELYCHEQSGDCQFSHSDIRELAKKYIEGEVRRLRNAPRSTQVPEWADEIGYPADFRFISYWHRTSQKFFDLGAEPEFQNWTIFLDTFWNHPDLSEADRQFIEQELEYEIDSYLMSDEKKHWNLYGGNNWTPVLNSAALHWALLYYYEKPAKAHRVIEIALRTNWLHRDYYLSDGGYIEGSSYLNTSWSPILSMHQLLQASFGEILHSVNWHSAAASLPQWVIDNMAPDGTLVDFGDAWADLGYSHIVPLLLSAHNEVLGLAAHASETPDACLVQQYFMNAYHADGFTNPWSIPAALARDWQAISADCQALLNPRSEVRVYPDYGQGSIRSFVPGASSAAESATEDNPYRRQADQTFLTVNTVRNDINHREMDFGALIWSAYGNRLLFDFGYGQIVRNYFEYDVFHRMGGAMNNQIDYALAANKLVVPSAFSTLDADWDWTRQFYTAEPYGTAGEVAVENIDGVEVILADGTQVLGGSSPAYMHRPAASGPLTYFYRWLVPIEHGNYLVIDAFQAKPGKESKIQEFWLTNDDNSANNSVCRTPLAQSSTDVRLTLQSANAVLLEPVCAQVPSGTDSETTARMIGAALSPGRFHTSIPDFLPTDPEFRTAALETRDGVAILKMRNRTGGDDRKKLFRWVPDNAVNEDVRVFLLQAATMKNGGLLAASVMHTSGNCRPEHTCFEITLGGYSRTLSLTKNNGRFQLVGLHN